ncbi:MAG: oxygen-independent coproporphyrinogen III oxidase [Betaproteobacteria bacterium]|nr:oxygen-independent coproporphyrinogen III oxidase [Betaproteobacteria bacterium]MDH3437707.1 oxygen-independent coproporphyrinogen III oxidase [Betaproteobacteria bacterium]
MGVPIEFDVELVRRFDRKGPRYTSYPTADRFVEAFGDEAYRTWAARRNVGGIQRPLSLYVHLPFCHDVCFYCACNKIVTRDAGKASLYLDYLSREIELQAELFREDPHVSQMHWGGGTPTYYDTAALTRLFARLAECFTFTPHGEYSIEIDPRTVDADTIHALREMGFNRASFGVQDFDPAVQAAVHRPQDEQRTLELIEAARRARFESVNIDLIYGLPKQTLMSFNVTLARVVAARPDRIALYNYAHLPTLFKPQRRINEADLPAPETKLKLLGHAIKRLGAAGYVYIGMDHFALPDDALTVAQRQGRLHRNFQGYSTSPEGDLVGLGVSSIGAIGPTYSQNHRTLEDYYDSLDDGKLPIMRGIELAADDLVRRAVIQALMCHFSLSKEAIEIAHLINFDRYFATELEELRELERLGLLALEDGWIAVTPNGRFLIRSICMVFDRYLRHDQEVRRYSRVI